MSGGQCHRFARVSALPDQTSHGRHAGLPVLSRTMPKTDACPGGPKGAFVWDAEAVVGRYADLRERSAFRRICVNGNWGNEAK